MQSLRIVPDLRSSVVEEMPATQALLFTSARTDADDELMQDPRVRPFTWGTYVRQLRDPELVVLEVAEPLWFGEWKKAVRYLSLAKTVRPGIRVATYAIENFDAAERLGSRTRAVGLSLRGLDLIAFGTSGAADNYRATFGPALDRIHHAVLPPRIDTCTVCGPTGGTTRERRVLFLGTPSERKGYPVLLEAWERLDPDWQLVVADPSGAEPPALPANADLRLDPPRGEIHELLRTSAVVVMPSVRRPGWREQIGLPLVEGLAHGCRVVTTTETGLADDLRDHPDVVLTTPGDATDLAEGLRGAMQRGAEAPSRDGHTKRDVVSWWLEAAKTPRRPARTGSP
ncbi:glycosyltransferase family 4 protein [Actinomycetospora termitidis]|uniref:Glycosyltransferase family 4 protein n=1 Tax=Actinomycetospora termitidis TaxID=3053470 RepID=A0ABT7M1C9_9PSEU|nr:glycosyltransferase family 4 protein [Actinomycetospora sp. Odt1-22]MDL5154459.1 glycosyltransferase family 4 protein [Actinomycetospora sp. Odt1-22]